MRYFILSYVLFIFFIVLIVIFPLVLPCFHFRKKKVIRTGNKERIENILMKMYADIEVSPNLELVDYFSHTFCNYQIQCKKCGRIIKMVSRIDENENDIITAYIKYLKESNIEEYYKVIKKFKRE